ncbi:hypothetical protein RRG08_044161 [Elysia crispata]|uniref:Uncharacterized protein n=1 Tax=Elysia crispata TaxID=231223 RepID=A0AAE0XWH1_9GAST|nr:hypothetical protein RRG08_044161 [Elysia crispata]
MMTSICNDPLDRRTIKPFFVTEKRQMLAAADTEEVLGLCDLDPGTEFLYVSQGPVEQRSRPKHNNERDTRITDALPVCVNLASLIFFGIFVRRFLFLRCCKHTLG